MDMSVTRAESLPVLLHRAASALDAATTSAEVLEARDMASVAYDVAKSAGRIARAKQAHDEVLSAVYRAQADALKIEARAKMRLADEYDAAQERGELRQANTGRSASALEAPGAEDIGLTHKQIYEARQLRDVEAEEPGVVSSVIDAMVDRGEEPTKAALSREIANRPHVAQNSGNNEWYTPADYITLAREVMGGVDVDPASSDIANQTVQADTFYTAEQDGLTQTWRGRVWCNPPYAQPLIAEFADAIANKYDEGEIEQACVLVNNATETGWFQRMLRSASAVCFPKSRIRFIDPQGNPSGAPLQGQAVLYFGRNVERFATSYSVKGEVLVRV